MFLLIILENQLTGYARLGEEETLFLEFLEGFGKIQAGSGRLLNA
jgi:hypothetical protein